jgi:hypothetical protein
LRQLADAAFAPPHAAEIPNTVSSNNALSDRKRFGLSQIGAFDRSTHDRSSLDR